MNHEKIFELAWTDPANTRYELPPVDVNQVLADRYELDRPLVYTRSMLWDMERRKARHPDVYIPNVVAEGSADAWGPEDTFVRKSMQRTWLDREQYTLVIEQTHLDDEEQRVTFIGAEEYEDLRASGDQAIFHVEHAVAGTEERPLNTWRIVHLTDDDRLVAVFERIAANPWLPEFIEIHIRDVLGVGITRKD